jgi:hypothetical protein
MKEELVRVLRERAWERHDTPNLCHLVAMFSADDLNRVVPAQQTDFGNISPVAVILPKRLATVWAAWCCADFATSELLLEARIGPNRFAFIA